MRELSENYPGIRFVHIPTGYWLENQTLQVTPSPNSQYKVVAPFTSEYDDIVNFKDAAKRLSRIERSRVCIVGRTENAAALAKEIGVDFLGYLDYPRYLQAIASATVVFIGRRGFNGIPTTPTRLTEALQSGTLAILHQSDTSINEVDERHRTKILTYRSAEELLDQLSSCILDNADTVTKTVLSYEANAKAMSGAYTELVERVTCGKA